MKYKILLPCLIVKLFSFAQITIDSGDFADGGDTSIVSISLDYELDYTTSGADYTWDFESLVMNSQRIDTFFNVGDASFTYQLVFNNGWLDPDYQADYYRHLLNFAIPPTDFIGFSIENPVGFTKIESDRVEIVGVGLEISGIEIPVKNEIIDVEYELPMNFGDNWISNSVFEIDLNPAFDGILKRYQERTAEVDGWGTLKTPYGTFDVIRTVAVLDFVDSVRFSFGGGDPIWLELPTPTQTVYTWWTKDQKIPVLQVISQAVFGSENITSVEYKDRYLGDVSLTDSKVLNPISIYPNPANEVVNFNSSQEITEVQILTVDGKYLTNFVWVKGSNQIDISNLPKGLYFIQFLVDKNYVIQQLLID